MTYEEFNNIVRVDKRIVNNNLELAVSVTIKRSERFPIEMCLPDNKEELIKRQDNSILELWTFLQSEMGHTDKELKQAYLKGLRDSHYI